MMLTARIGAAAAYFASLIYSTVYLKKSRRPSYFKCVFYGLLPLCLASFFHLVLEVRADLQAVFSLGILGEASAYIFVTNANTALIIKEQSERERHFSLPGFVCAGAGLVILLVPAVRSFSLSGLFTFAVYAASMCPCLYFSMEGCVNRFHNPMRGAVRPFSLLVIVHIFATALCALIPVLPDAAGTPIAVLCLLGWLIPGIAGMYMLKKGLEPWEL